MIVYGVYHWWPKRTAFRNDYCLFCQTPRLAEQIRMFDVGHIFWIPILPGGFWKRWYCTVCHHDPHEHPGTRRIFKWIGLAILVLFAIVGWAIPEPPDEIMWAMRIICPMGAALTLVHLLRTPPDTSLIERVATLMPANQTTCPFCGTQLIVGERCFCPACGVVRC